MRDMDRSLFKGKSGWHALDDLPTPKVVFITLGKRHTISRKIKYAVGVPAYNKSEKGYSTVGFILNYNTPIMDHKVYISFDPESHGPTALIFNTKEEAQDCIDKEIMPLLNEKNYIDTMESYYDRELE